MLIKIITPEIMYVIFRFSINGNLVLVRSSFDHPIQKESFFPFFNRLSKTRRVMKIDEKSDVIIPIIKVVANPFIGPDPSTRSTIAVRRVVKFPSIIAE